MCVHAQRVSAVHSCERLCTNSKASDVASFPGLHPSHVPRGWTREWGYIRCLRFCMYTLAQAYGMYACAHVHSATPCVYPMSPYVMFLTRPFPSYLFVRACDVNGEGLWTRLSFFYIWSCCRWSWSLIRSLCSICRIYWEEYQVGVHTQVECPAVPVVPIVVEIFSVDSWYWLQLGTLDFLPFSLFI